MEEKNMKKIISYFLLFLSCTLLIGCSKKENPNTYSLQISKSSFSKNFSLKSDTATQKNTINKIISLYKNYNLIVTVRSFNDGYMVQLKNQSLLPEIRNNDKDGLLTQKIIPVTQQISAETNSKIYFNANDPNQELITTMNHGKKEYQIQLN